MMENRFMTKGKVVLLPFPFDDLSTVKVRPAVCLTNPIGLHRHVVVAFLTSHIPTDLLETDIVLAAQDRDFAATGLRISSTLRLHRLMTISTNLIQRELGKLSSSLQADVIHKLRTLFERDNV
jgi:mRNA interferase MazF